MNNDLTTERRDYLDIIRRISVACFQRASMERCELCVENTSEPERDSLERYAKLRIHISNLTTELRKFEEDTDKRFGVLALLGFEPEPAIRIAAGLLLARAIFDSVNSRLNTVGEVADYAIGSSSPQDLLAIRRSLVRGSGILRPHCAITINHRRVVNLDQCYITLTEKSFCVMLALPQAESLEFDYITPN